MASYEAHSAYDAGRRRSNAAAAYAAQSNYRSTQYQSEYDRPQYEPGEPVMPGSAPYAPPTSSANGSQPQHPGMRRPSSSCQQPTTAPIAVPRHPGLQQAASYGQPTASYGGSPSASQQTYGTATYDTPPFNSYGQQIPPQNIYPPSSYSQYGGQQRMPNSRPGTSNGTPPRQGYSDRYEDAVTFDEKVNDAPSGQHSRTYSRSSQGSSGRRLSAQDAHLDEYGRRMSVQDAYNDRGRRSSRHSAYESSDEDDDDYDRSHQQRRSSKVSTHSKSSRGSGQRKSSSKPETRTYGDSVEWAYKGVKKLLTSKREP